MYAVKIIIVAAVVSRSFQRIEIIQLHTQDLSLIEFITLLLRLKRALALALATLKSRNLLQNMQVLTNDEYYLTT